MIGRWLIVLLCALALPGVVNATQIPDRSELLAGYDRDSVEQRLLSLPLHDIEGIWQFTENGSLIVIERFKPTESPDDGVVRYRMVVLQSPRLSVRRGTVMGYLWPTAKRNCFDARIYTDFDGGSVLTKAKRFTLSLDDESRLAFTRHKSGVRINLWRFVPYMFRYSVSSRDDRPRNIDGCVKIFPVSSRSQIQPRYL